MSIKSLLASAILCIPVLTAQSQTLPSDTIFFEDGSWYCGEIADSLFEGHGTMFYSDSTIYSGEWKAGLWNGQGTLTYPDGDSYTGNFLNHEFSGAGVYTYHDGAKYDGYWKESMFNGAGTFSYADGSTYTGLWENDKKEGIGMFYEARSNTIFKGQFHNDQFVYETDDYGNPVMTRQLPVQAAPEKEPGEYLFGVTLSSESNLSFNFDFECTESFMAGFSIGFNVGKHGKGLQAVEYDEQTGQRYDPIAWNDFPGEKYMEHEYTMFHLFGECELHSRRIGIGGALGFGLLNKVRDCKSQGGYYEVGQLYYKQKTIGAVFGIRIFSDIVLREMTIDGNKIKVATRVGYGNLDGAYFGLQVCL